VENDEAMGRAMKGRIFGLFPDLLGVGGVQEAGRMTAIALSEIAKARGWSVDFLSLNDPPGQHRLSAAPEIALHGYGRAKVRFVLSALRLAREAAEAEPCIALAAHPNLAVPAAWMMRTAPRLRTIVMAHGIEVWTPLPRFRRRALARADVVLAPSRYTAQQLVDVQGIAPEKVQRLPWPLNPSFLRLADATASLPLPQGFPSGQVILTVGRWASSERYKGADELIRAVASLSKSFPDMHMVAVGSGDDLPRLRGLAAELGVSAQVVFLENLSREQTAACYASADIFALPSTGEGFGLVFLEAMTFSKPIVGVAAGGAMDVVEDGVNGFLLPPGDAQSLQQTLERLLGDSSLREKLGRRGSQIVREKYAFATFQRNLEHILDPHTVGEGRTRADGGPVGSRVVSS
jgi:glycosyltransferase involved in cell wall biosynthesis